MDKVKKYIPLIFPSLFFLMVFILSISPLSDFDIWFHLKSGEILSKLGIIHYDVFAFTTQGREWNPYEWLFQIIVYFYSVWFGTNAIPYLTAFIGTVLVLTVYRILNKVFDLNIYLSILLCFFFFTSIYEFISPRPQIFAYTFLCLNLYLILNFFFKNKNYLIFTLPITLLWTNLHGSIFINTLFFAGFAFASLANSFLFKEKHWLSKFKVLALYAFISFLLTTLPPLGLTQYKLLWKFFENRELITKFISEWTPLSVSLIPFILYTSLALLVIILYLFISVKQKTIRKSIWVLPILPLVISPYLASRNSFLGYLAITIIAASIIPNLLLLLEVKLRSFKKTQIIYGIIISLFILFFSWMIFDKKREQGLYQNYYPINATKFIKDYDLKGNMFNEYGFGGYLLYHLYPKQKVYFDGRTDLYLCCEMPDTLNLAINKHQSDAEYKKILDNLWSKNDISFVLVRTEKHVVLRKIARILQDDSEWTLVYWDDVSQIFVKKDGKNDNILTKFGALAATPYAKDPYRKGSLDKALGEYYRMIKVADSSKSRNTIGFILLQEKKFDEAKLQFEKAIAIYPYNESPYMNLAEISLKEQNPQKAIELYKAALKLAPDRGLIYIRLGQIILGYEGNVNEAIRIWKEGREKTVDTSAKKTLEMLLESTN